MSALADHRPRTARLAGRAVLALQSDARLAALAADGHERAFDVLVDRYRRPLVRYCSRIVPESRAEDAVQQAFINVHAALTRGDAPDDFKPWLYTVTRHAAINMLRQNGWNHEPIPPELDGVLRPDQIAEQRIDLENAVGAIGALPERQRTALVMREFEGRSYAEIALALGAGDGAVRQLLSRARIAVRSTATMLTPPPLVLRVATSYPSDGRGSSRAAEILAGLGTGGIAKAGATALVAGSLVVGAVKAPAPFTGHHGNAEGAKDSAAETPARAEGRAIPAAEADGFGGAADVRHGRRSRHGRTGGDGRGGERHSGRDDRRERSGTGDRRGSDDHSGSRTRSGSDDRSGSSESEHTTTGRSDDPVVIEDRSGSGASGESTSGGSETTTTMETSSSNAGESSQTAGTPLSESGSSGISSSDDSSHVDG